MRLNEPKCDKCLKTLQAERLELSNKRRGYANKDDTNTNVEKNANDKSNESVKPDDQATSPSTQNVQESNINNDGSMVDDYDECDYDDDDNGESGIAIAKCLDCDMNLCSNCLLEHQIINLDMNHKLISLIMTNGCINPKQQQQQQQQQQQHATLQTMQMQIQNQHQLLTNEINNNCLKMQDKNNSGMDLLGFCADANNNGLLQQQKSNGKLRF
jgi:hypothetical protein